MDTLHLLNNSIRSQVCYDTIDKLSDEKLIDHYLESKSVSYKIKNIRNILKDYVPEHAGNEIITRLIQANEIVPPGVKGAIRGVAFNKIVCDALYGFNLDPRRFEIGVETMCPYFKTSERPDWYIYDHDTEKVIIGMNQIDLWSGGHQYNRGYNYIVNTSYNTEKSKLLCVIAKDVEIKSFKNKTYKLFKIGITNQTICYMRNLEYIIMTYFQITH